ncbi:MAG: Fic family protein [Firmicutes bacterium]|nr:Fic family protein [Bacillota bacterium]
MEYIKVAEAAKKWNLSDRRVRVLCQEAKIEGVTKIGGIYLIPENAVKPADSRRLKGKIIPAVYKALFAKIDSLKEENKGKSIGANFRVEYIYNSNALVGNTLSQEETALVLSGKTIDKKPMKDHLEAVGGRDAYSYMLELVSKKIALSEGIIKKFHSLILLDKPEYRGVYRHVPVKVLGAFHIPPEPYKIENKLVKLLDEFSKSKAHPIEKITYFLLKFEGIHPFFNGNSRTARMILNTNLMENGYLPIIIKKSDKLRYYECIDSFYRDSTTEPMIKLITERLEDSYKTIS